LRLCCCF